MFNANDAVAILKKVMELNEAGIHARFEYSPILDTVTVRTYDSTLNIVRANYEAFPKTQPITVEEKTINNVPHYEVRTDKMLKILDEIRNDGKRNEE